MAKECDQESLRGSRKPQEGASGPQSGGESGKQVPKCKKIDPRGIEKNIRKKTETLNIDDPLKECLLSMLRKSIKLGANKVCR